MQVGGDSLVHFDNPQVPVGAGPRQQLFGGDQLLPVLGQELRSGDEDRAVQAPLTELTPGFGLVGALKLQTCR